MAVAVPTGPVPAHVRSLPRAVLAECSPLAVAATAVTVGLVFIVGHDGTWLWQFVRVGAALGIGVSLVLAVSRLTGVRRAGAAFAGGLIALPVGLGIAGPHLFKSGMTAMALAGLVTFAGAGVLAVGGATSLVRATPRWWRIATIPTLFIVVVLTLFVVTQSVALTNVPPTTVGSVTPADRGLAYRDVEFSSRDGVTLSGWFVPSRNGAAVVLLHGSGSTRADVLDQAAVLARHGYGVLLFDARGHGRSHGRAMDAGWWGDEDTAGAVTFLQNQPDVDAARIAAVGMSMGGEEALGAAAADTRIRAVVAEGATQRSAADRAWLPTAHGLRGSFQLQLDHLGYGLAGLLTDAPAPTPLHDAVAAMAPRPALLIAAGTVADEQQAGRFIQRSSPSTVELWTVPGAAHTGGLATAPLEWEQRVTTFLARAIGG